MNKIDELTERLRKELADSDCRIGDHFPSEYELTERYHVSRLTANKAMSILAAEGLLERKGRGAGTVVRRKRVFPAGFFAAFTNLRHLYTSQILEGISQCALRFDYCVVPFTPSADKLVECLNKLASSECKGVFVMDYGALPSDFPKPAVYLDLMPPDDSNMRYHSVVCDNYGAAFSMMKSVIASGRKEIAVLTMPAKHRALRRAGFADALKDSGFSSPDERLFLLTDKTGYDVENAFLRMRARWPKLDFIVTDSDDLVFELMKLFRALHIEMPSGIGLSGFGNIHGISDLYNIPTVDQHPWHMGEAAVHVMMDLLKNGEPGKAVQIKIPTELVNRLLPKSRTT